MQHVEQLPLVLVKPLHLHVEERAAIDLEFGLLLDVGGERVLVALLDLAHLAPEGLVLGERLEAVQLLEVDGPAVSDPGGDGVGEERVRLEQPPARSHSVGVVVESR